jgi:pimeloyl-ACP methyl ester carboxylesterase
VPILVLPGEKDSGTPPALSETIHRAIPGSEYTVVPDAAHLANIEQASVFNDRISQFLRRHAS